MPGWMYRLELDRVEFWHNHPGLWWVVLIACGVVWSAIMVVSLHEE